MRLSWFAIVVPLLSGAVAAVAVTLSAWDGLRLSLLPALSVVAAGVLVRLARGLPFTNADHFQLDEFRDVANAMEHIARSLRMLIYVCLGAMLALTVLPLGVPRFDDQLVPVAAAIVNRSASFILGATVAYAFVRVLEVVEGDISLLKLQASTLDQYISRKNATGFETKMANRPATPIAGAQRFGTQL